jgi:hypothetical protein
MSEPVTSNPLLVNFLTAFATVIIQPFTFEKLANNALAMRKDYRPFASIARLLILKIPTFDRKPAFR